MTRCTICGALLRLVGRAHRCTAPAAERAPAPGVTHTGPVTHSVTHTPGVTHAPVTHKPGVTHKASVTHATGVTHTLDARSNGAERQARHRAKDPEGHRQRHRAYMRVWRQQGR